MSGNLRNKSSMTILCKDPTKISSQHPILKLWKIYMPVLEIYWHHFVYPLQKLTIVVTAVPNRRVKKRGTIPQWMGQDTTFCNFFFQKWINIKATKPNLKLPVVLHLIINYWESLAFKMIFIFIFLFSLQECQFSTWAR